MSFDTPLSQVKFSTETFLTESENLQKRIDAYNKSIANNKFNVKEKQIFADINSGKIRNRDDSMNLYLAQQFKTGSKADLKGYNQYIKDNLILMTQSKEGIAALSAEYKRLGTLGEEGAQAQQRLNAEISAFNPQLAKVIAANPGATYSKLNAELIKSKIAAFGAKAAYTAMNMAMTMGISFLITTAISAISALVNRTRDLAAAGAEAAETFKKETDSLDEQISKIKEYRKTLADGNTTEKEAYDTRSNLLNIQNELYDTYGKEAAGIDLVNGSLSTQLDLLQQLKGAKASDFLTMNQKEIEEAEKLLNKKHNKKAVNTAAANWFANDYSIEFQAGNSPKIQNEFKKIVKDAGLQYTSGYINAVNMTDTETIAAWKSLSKAIQNSDVFDKDDRQIKALLGQIEEELKDLEDETYTNAIKLRDQTAAARIQENDEYLRQYLEITEAINNYQEAIKSGNKTDANKYLDTINELKANLNIDDEWVEGYINDLFDKVSDEITKKEYIKKLQKSTEKLAGGLTEAENTKRIAEKWFGGLSAEQILSSYDGKGDSVQDRLLKEFADENGISIKQLVSAWEELGYIEKAVNGETENTIKTYKNLSEALEDVRKESDQFTAAIEKIQNGEYLDFSTVDELLKVYPDLLDYIEKTANGYKVEASALEKARQAVLKDKKLDITSNISDNRAAIDNLYDEIKAEKKKIEGYEDIKKVLQEIKKLQTKRRDAYILNEPKIEQYKKYLHDTYNIEADEDNLYTDINQKITASNKLISKKEEEIKAINKQIKQQQFLWQGLVYSATDYAEKISNAASKGNSMSELFAKMEYQQDQSGSIAPDTLLELMDQTDKWADYVEVCGDKVTLVEGAYEKAMIAATGFGDIEEELTEKIKSGNTSLKNKETSLALLMKQYGLSYDTEKSYGENLEYLRKNLEKNNKMTPDLRKNLYNLEDEYMTLSTNVDGTTDSLESFYKIMQLIYGYTQKHKLLQDFENDIADLQHQLNMGEITQDAFDDAYAQKLEQLKKDADDDGSLSDTDKETMRGYEETNYNQQIANAQRHYEERKQLLDNALEDNLLTYEQYRDKLIALNEEYYGVGTTLGETEDGKKQYAANLREIAAQTKNTYDQELKNLDDRKAKGLISIEDYWQQRYALGEKYLAKEASLADEWADEQTTILVSGTTDIYNSKMSDLDHRKAMGEIYDDDAYYSEFEQIQNWLKNSPAANYEEIQELIKSGDEKLYQYSLDSAEKNYNKEKQIYDRALEDKKISYIEFINDLKKINEDYYGEGTLLGETEEGKEKYEENSREIVKYSKDAYDDLTGRIDSAISAGYINDDTLLEQIQQVFGEDVPKEIEDAIERIKERGYMTELDAAIFGKYLSDDLLSAPSLIEDKKNAESQINQNKSAYFDDIMSRIDNAIDDGIISDDDIQRITDAFGKKVPEEVNGILENVKKNHKLNNGEAATIEKYLSDNLLAGIPQLEDKRKSVSDDVSSKNKAQYDKELHYLENQLALGIIDRKKYWEERERLDNKYLANDTRLIDDWTDEQVERQTTKMVECFEDEHKKLEKSLQQGEITYSEYIDEYLKLWAEYYKDKKALSDEDIEAQKTILDEYKQGIDNNISALEAQNEKISKPYQDEIDAYEEVQEKVDKIYDNKIKALQDQLDILNKQKEEEEKLKEIEEKRKALADAQRNIYKSLRMVYSGNGQWEVKPSQDALDEYKKAQEELEEASEETEIEKLQKQIEELEKEKEKYDEGVQVKIESLNDSIEAETAMNNLLIQALQELTKQTYNYDPEITRRALESRKGQEAVKAINDKQETKEKLKKEVPVEAEIITDKVTDESVGKIGEEVSKNNQTTEEQAASIGLDFDSYAAATDENTSATQENTSSIENQQTNTETADNPTEDVPLPDSKEQEQSPEYIPISEADITSLTNETRDLIAALTSIKPDINNIASNIKTTGNVTTAPLINNTINSSPVVNMTVNIEGSADEKTVQRFRDVTENIVGKAFTRFADTTYNETLKSLHSS